MKRFFLSLTSLLLSWCSFSQVINRAEYFFDADPGRGNGTGITLTSGASVNVSINASTSSLSSGFHTFNVRLRDSNNVWSLSSTRTFYIIDPATLVTASTIVRAEYFIDNDPGRGNGVNVPVTSGTTVSPPIAIDISSLSSGFHTFNFRTKDNQGRWAHFMERTFYIFTPAPSIGTLTLVEAEYFIDSDPGVGAGTSLSISSAGTQNNTFGIDLGSLASGFHHLAIRYRDNAGHWSAFQVRTFYITSLISSSSDVVKLEYFIDTDPGYDKGNNLLSSSSPAVDTTVPVDLSGIPPGNHVLYIRAKDSKGFWSEVVEAPFVIQNCTPPSPPVTTGNSRCGAGTLALSATGASGTQVYRWYDDAITSTVTATGTTFTTPSLNATKSYYVSIFDPGTTCESSRTLVVATVTIIPQPSLNLSGTISFCEGNSIFLTAPNGFSKYLWSDGRTTQQISVTANGDYWVKTGDASGCFSISSDTLSAYVIPAPAKPIVNITGSTTLCGTETTTLSAPASDSYIWSTGETTQDIQVSAEGNYSVSVRNATGCQSISSDAVSITRVTDEATITQDGVLLIASAGQQYQWYLNGVAINGATGQTLEISVAEFGVYAVEVTTGSCFSKSDDYQYLVTPVENPMIEKFIVTPNPVAGMLSIDNQLSEAADMMIVDALGKTILHDVVTPGQHVYDVASLDAGIYYMLSKTTTQAFAFKLHKL